MAAIRVGWMRVVFVTMTKQAPARMHCDASVVYRCVNPARQLRALGYDARVHHVDALPADLRADVAIFHRPRDTPSFRRARRALASAATWCDLDDLLFDDSVLEQHPALLSGRVSRRSLLAETATYRGAAGEIGRSLVSSPELGSRLVEVYGNFNAHVVRNGWDEQWRAMGTLVPPRPSQQSTRVISYFAGTANHRDDLRECTVGVNAFASRTPGVTVEIYGSIDPGRMGLSPDLWKPARSVPFYALPTLIRRSWVAIAPLRKSPFNDCKSAIKFVETGIFECPLIASRLPEIERIDDSGVSIAETVDEWTDSLERLMSPQFYAERTALAKSAASKHAAKLHVRRLIWALGLEAAS